MSYPAPGSAERRRLDKQHLRSSGSTYVKNPSRYGERLTGSAFGIVSSDGEAFVLEVRDGSTERYDSVDALFDAGWTVD